ncbi:Transcriptional regulator, LysR family [hydrothermal vent metagenome]|uniref:Transcriptional regulator, LysR family n=1 Tax=hydrothermal vent metagenome TaxID=652676 RepID=A0A3B0YS41_9ZZZZ
MDRFEEIQTFISIVKAGSFSLAAERMNIAKSAVSRRLAELESRLGIQLLTRTTRRMNLTESGRHYFKRCQAILADLEETEHTLTTGDIALNGSIRIAAPMSFGLSHLSPVINQFLKQNSQLAIELVLDDRTVNFMDEEVDLAIRIGKLVDSRLVGRKLSSSHLVICASPEYLKTFGEPQQPSDLDQHTGFSYSYDRPTDWTFDNIKIPIRMRYQLRANNGVMLLNAAIDGLGIILTPKFIAAKAIQQGLLKPILTRYQLSKAGIYVVYQQQHHLPQRIKVLISYLVDQFKNLSL